MRMVALRWGWLRSLTAAAGSLRRHCDRPLFVSCLAQMTGDEIRALRNRVGLWAVCCAIKLNARAVETWEQGRRHPEATACLTAADRARCRNDSSALAAAIGGANCPAF